MRIGMFYQIQVPKPWDAGSEALKFHQMLDQVVFAEEVGFESVWFVEHHFRSEWSHSSAPDLSLAAISQRTTNMRLGIAAVLPPIHHPLHTAVRMATLDILSNGRVDFGVGRSGYPYQMMPFGTDLADSTGIVEESLKIIPLAWTEKTFSFKGKYFDIPEREVIPKPVQQPHPPMWQACTREETFEKAGLQGLGCLTQTSIGAERTEMLVRIYRDAIQKANPIGKFVNNQISGSTVAYCHENRDKAIERGAQLIDWYREQQRIRDSMVWKDYPSERVPDDYRWHYERAMARDDARADEVSSRDLIEMGGRFAIGTPDDCIEYLEQYEAMGVDEVMPLFQVGPVSHEEVMQSLSLFGKYVVPHFQAKSRAKSVEQSQAVQADD
ncbi:MAG: LLM class flavin-dependent oxidoreductase [Chloroflexi bacterium]|nr:LLM class flavin-dependent oxidoreductase [Chloroflexota bacterium]MDA1226676.1 LLM class flavin-dependent oxidoreductase [Chloroflexota bacterium]